MNCFQDNESNSAFHVLQTPRDAWYEHLGRLFDVGSVICACGAGTDLFSVKRQKLQPCELMSRFCLQLGIRIFLYIGYAVIVMNTPPPSPPMITATMVGTSKNFTVRVVEGALTLGA